MAKRKRAAQVKEAKAVQSEVDPVQDKESGQESVQLSIEEGIAEQKRLYEEQLVLYEASRKLAGENRKYSEQEYDKLIVSLASGGLVVTIGFVKDIIKITRTTDTSLLLLCWVAFVLCLLSNLLSHRLAVRAMDSFLSDEDKWKTKDNYTKLVNHASLGLLALGMIFFVCFVVQNLSAMANDTPKTTYSTKIDGHPGQTHGLTGGSTLVSKPTPPISTTPPTATSTPDTSQSK